MKWSILCLATFLLFCSCSKTAKVEEVLEGWWTMDTIYYKNYDIRACLGQNSLDFSLDSKSELPIAEDKCGPFIKDSYDRFAKVQVINSDIANDTLPLRLKIITKNEIFAGTHKIVFYKDTENQLLKMEIFSDNLYIVCRKGLFNFNKNQVLIEDLEAISWITRPDVNNK